LLNIQVFYDLTNCRWAKSSRCFERSSSGSSGPTQKQQ